MDVEEILSNAGLRRTRPRITVLSVLYSHGVPMSHGEILLAAGENLDKVTLYRTLETLKKAGIVHQVQGIDGVWRFCAHDRSVKGCPGGHPHFLCLVCGKMFCLTDQKMPRVEVPDGARVDGKQFVIYGACPACAAEKDSKKCNV